MSRKDDNGKDLDDLQTSAIVASVTIVVFFLVYWGIQIQDVMEMLELAYGQE